MSYISGTESIQVELERGMQEAGRQRYLASVSSAVERGAEVGTPYGQRLLSLHTTRLAEAIEEFKTEAEGKRGRRHGSLEFLNRIDARTCAWITLHTLLNHISRQHLKLTALGATIGRSILVEIEMRSLRKNDKALFTGVLRATERKTQQYRKEVTARFLQTEAGLEVASASPKDCALLGIKLVELVIEKLGLITFETTTQIRPARNNIRNHVIRATSELIDWIRRGHEIFSELDPVYGPMVVPPAPWTHPLVGGYLTNDVKPLTLVKTRSRKYLERLAKQEMPQVYEAVNRIQETAWRINRPILDVIEQILQTNSELGGMPRAELVPIPDKPADIDTNEEARKAYRKAALAIHQDNVVRTSRGAKVASIVRTAKKYRPYEAIYFPYQLDFRGRVYPVTTLSPQGEDFVKALLEFSEGEPLGTQTAADWLAIHIANLFGVDKVSFEDRIAWTKENSNMLLAIAADPFENREWCDADKPFQALAAALEWRGYTVDGLKHVSRIPVALDGSCSGLQNFGMALRCETTGKAVNLVPADKPQDIYQDVIDKCMVRLVEITGEDWASRTLEATLHKARKSIEAIYHTSTLNLPIEAWTDHVIAKQYDDDGKVLKRLPIEQEAFTLYWSQVTAYLWLHFGVDQETGRMSRKIAKRAVMTFPYSSKEFGFRDQLLEDIVIPNEEAFQEHGWKAAGLMAKLLWEAVNETVIRAALAMQWLQDVARIVAKAGRRISWNTPLGFLVEQGYVKTDEQVVHTTFAGKERFMFSLSKETAIPCSRKNASAMAPNWIHALDSSHLMLTVARAPDIKNWAVIHDSFGTLPSRTQSLFLYVRVAFMELYSKHHVLQEFYDQMRMLEDPNTKQLLEIPAPPTQGNLDLYSVLQSRYCFA